MAKQRRLNVAEFLERLVQAAKEAKEVSQRIDERLGRLREEIREKEELAYQESKRYDPDCDWF